MARPRKEAKESTSSSLIQALKFISVAQREVGSPTQCFCQLSDGKAIASDGILTASHPIEEELNAKPHTGKLLSALNHCGKNLSITQLENRSLSIRSGKFFVYIPCYGDEFPILTPDEPQIAITDSIKIGFEKIAQLTQDAAQTVINSSIQLHSGSMLATNSIVALEYWHGIDLPTMNIPKPFAAAVIGVGKKLKAMGFSQSSVTFWFEDDSWLKTQVYAEPWPDINYVFDMPKGMIVIDLPIKFYEALHCIEDFCEEGRDKGTTYLSESGMRSHPTEGQGAFYELKGLNKVSFNIKQLKNIQRCCKKIGIGDNTAWFFGDNLRGRIMGVK